MRPIAFPNVHDIILINDSNRATNEVLLQTQETNIEFKTNMIAVVTKKKSPVEYGKKSLTIWKIHNVLSELSDSD